MKKEDLKNQIIHDLVRDAYTGTAELQAYLTDTGSLKDSAAQLAPVTVDRYVYPICAAEEMATYRQRFGWDAFLCRCAAAMALGFRGRWMYKLVYEGLDFSGITEALLGTDLPLPTVLDVLAGLYDSFYPHPHCQGVQDAACKAVNRPRYLKELCTAAPESRSFGRQIALSVLDGFTALPGQAGEQAKAGILACAGDSSKQIHDLLVTLLAGHPDWAGDYAALLKGKKTAQRLLAAEVSAKLGGALRPELEAALAVEKNAKVADAIQAALNQGATPTGEDASANLDGLADRILKGGKRRKIRWLLDSPLPTLHLTGGGEVSENRRDALLMSYCELGRIGRSETAAQLTQGIDQKDLAALAYEVYERWLAAGAQNKTKWVLPFAAVYGGPAMIPKLTHAIDEWPQNARGAIACDAVTALTLSGDPTALLAVDGIARKFKFRQVKAAAGAALENAAQELGITLEELADRMVPTLGFSADGKRVFDYGPRTFTVRLTPTLELEITSDSGKTFKTLPVPGKTDDPAKATAAHSDFKAMKKQIRTTAATQKARLEETFSVLRCWTSDSWRALFVHNPIMHQFAMSLIWGVYQEGRLQTTFRYMEDGSLTTVDEEEYQLPDNARIGLAHPVELDQETLEGWKQQLEDYEITQSIRQLDRPIFRPEPGTEQNHSLERFGGKRLNNLTLLSKLKSLGWYRGSVDGGAYDTFYREDPTLGLGVELHFSGGMVGDERYNTVTVYDAVFYRQDDCCGDDEKEHSFALGEVPARYYSEVVCQLEQATVFSFETVPDWKANR